MKLCIIMFNVFTIINISVRSNCRQRVHGVYCWSKPLWTDDFLPVGWLVGQSPGLYPPAPNALPNCVHFVQYLLLHARDISMVSKILDAWSSVLCWSKLRLVFIVLYSISSNIRYLGYITQFKCNMTVF